MARILFVVPCSPFWPSGVVRVEQYAQHLRRDGWELHVVNYFSPAAARLRRAAERVRMPLLSALVRLLARAAARSWDTVHAAVTNLRIARAAGRREDVYIQWVTPPRWLTAYVARRTRLVYDFDDATFLLAPRRVDTLLRSSEVTVAGSHALKEYADVRARRVVLIPSSVPVERFGENAAPAPPLTIGWIGSTSTLPQLETLAPVFERLERAGIEFRILAAGTGPAGLFPSLRSVPIERIEAYSSADLPALVSKIDIGIMPLIDSAWTRAKCSLKLLLYMAGRKPVVASAVGEAEHMVEHGRSGFLVRNESEWQEALTALMADAALRHELGARGREIVEERYSTDSCYRLLRKQVLETPAA